MVDDSGLPDLSALDEVALGAEGFEQLLAGMAAVVAPTLRAQKCGVMLWQPTPRALQMLPGSFGAPEPVTASYRVHVDDPQSNAARVFSSGTPFCSNHAEGDPGILQDYVAAFDIERLVSVRLEIGSLSTGVVHFANRDEPFGAADVALAERLARRVAVAVAHVSRLVLLHRKERLAGVLARVAELIASGASLDRILPPAMADLLDISGGSCVALSPRSGRPIVLSASGVRAPVDDARFLAAAGAQPATAQEHVTPPDGAGDPGETALHVPVAISDERVGTLSLMRGRAEPLSPDEREGMLRLADLAALAWATERYQQERAEMARMRERERIADDLHDHAAQIVFSAKTALEATLEDERLDVVMRGSLTRARELLAAGELAIREAVLALTPPAGAGLAERLEHLVLDVQERFGIVVHLDVGRSALPAGFEERALADLAVRVCREALVNAAKHAGPSRVRVDVGQGPDGRLLLQVEDDGIGPPDDAAADGHGLPALRRAIEEQGGSLEIGSGGLGGTTVAATLGP